MPSPRHFDRKSRETPMRQEASATPDPSGHRQFGRHQSVGKRKNGEKRPPTGPGSEPEGLRQQDAGGWHIWKGLPFAGPLPAVAGLHILPRELQREMEMTRSAVEEYHESAAPPPSHPADGPHLPECCRNELSLLINHFNRQTIHLGLHNIN